LNSGTEHDWVSSDLLGERLGLQEEEPISELDVIDFQGHKFTAKRKVLLSWHSLKMKKNSSRMVSSHGKRNPFFNSIHFSQIARRPFRVGCSIQNNHVL